MLAFHFIFHPPHLFLKCAADDVIELLDLLPHSCKSNLAWVPWFIILDEIARNGSVLSWNDYILVRVWVFHNKVKDVSDKVDMFHGMSFLVDRVNIAGCDLVGVGGIFPDWED